MSTFIVCYEKSYWKDCFQQQDLQNLDEGVLNNITEHVQNRLQTMFPHVKFIISLGSLEINDPEITKVLEEHRGQWVREKCPWLYVPREKSYPTTVRPRYRTADEARQENWDGMMGDYYVEE